MGKIRQPTVIFFRILPLTRHGLWTLGFGLRLSPFPFSGAQFSLSSAENLQRIWRRGLFQVLYFRALDRTSGGDPGFLVARLQLEEKPWAAGHGPRRGARRVCLEAPGGFL